MPLQAGAQRLAGVAPEAEPALRRAAAAAGRPASIVNIGTHAGVRPKGSSIPYAASKAALHHVTKLLALSLGAQAQAPARPQIATTKVEDFDRFLHVFSTKGAVKRKEHGSKGATVFRDLPSGRKPRCLTQKLHFRQRGRDRNGPH